MDDHVALTRCYFCGEPDKILLATKYYHTKSGMQPIHSLKPMHDKVIDMEPCSKCQEWMKQGIILLTIDEIKSDEGWNKQPIPNPYRTGGFSVIRDEAFARMMPPGEIREFALRKRFMFIDQEVAEKIGLTAMEKGNK